MAFAFEASAKVLWSSQYANFTDLIRNAYPVGNGQLAGTAQSRIAMLSIG